MSDQSTKTITDTLAPLLPQGAAIQSLLDGETLGRLEASWQELTNLGFQVGVGENQLVVQHQARGFESVIQLSRPDDLGELRSLFLGLRSHFGRLRDRWLPWMFLPGPAVTAPYEHLRQVIGICQRLRQAS